MAKKTTLHFGLYILLWLALSIGLIHYYQNSYPKKSVTSPITSSDEIWTITDLHYLSPSLHDGGIAFQKMQNTSAGKDLAYSKERMEALVYQVSLRHPKILLVSGDLTFNGEYQSAKELAEFFDEIESLGTTVLVIPGNHDIADGWARKFQDDKNFKIKQITKKEWASLFSHHGYDRASSYDTASLSYLEKSFSNLWFLMIDSNIYTEQGDGRGAPTTNGVVKKETLHWIEQQLQEATTNNVTIIPVIHHNLLDHHELVTSGFTLDNASDLRTLLAQYPSVFFGFSGHIHSQHIAVDTLMTSSHSYTEVVNGAFSIYPSTIGVTTVSDDHRVHYQRQSLDTHSWALATQQTNSDLLQHQEYLKKIFNTASQTLVEQSLYEEQWFSAPTAAAITTVLTPLNLAYFTGEKIPQEWLTNDYYPSEAYQLLKEHADTSFLYHYSEQILRENRQGNHLEITVLQK